MIIFIWLIWNGNILRVQNINNYNISNIKVGFQVQISILYETARGKKKPMQKADNITIFSCSNRLYEDSRRNINECSMVECSRNML